jgi:hypothetical protein
MREIELDSPAFFYELGRFDRLVDKGHSGGIEHHVEILPQPAGGVHEVADHRLPTLA